MDVNYRWSFLIGDTPCVMRRQRAIPAQTYAALADEEDAGENPMLPTDSVMEIETQVSWFSWVTQVKFLSIENYALTKQVAASFCRRFCGAWLLFCVFFLSFLYGVHLVGS